MPDEHDAVETSQPGPDARAREQQAEQALLEEYLADGSTAQRREAIQALFWRRWHAAVRRIAQRQFAIRFPQHPLDSPECESVIDAAMVVLLDPNEFAALARKHQPDKGRPFRRFLLQQAEWRSRDKVDQLARSGLPSHRKVPVEDQRLPVPTQDTAAGPSSKWQQRLNACLAHVRNPEARTAFELRYMAYLNPAHFSRTTKDRLGPETLARLQEEFDTAQDELHRLETEELPEAHARLLVSHRQLQECRQEWEQAGRPDGIEQRDIQEALALGLAELEALARQAQEAGNEPERARRRWQLAYKRHEQARRRVEVLKDRRARYQQLRSPWVRSEAAIAGLMGLSQPTVHRRLVEALGDLRRHSHAQSAGSGSGEE